MQGKPLSKLKPGEQQCVVGFSHLAERHIQKLLVLGVFPGVPVEVLQVSPTLVIQFEHTQLALDHEIASHIYVAGQ